MNTHQLPGRSYLPTCAILCSTALVLSDASPAPGKEEMRHWQNNTSRAYSLEIPGGQFMVGTPGKVEAWAFAHCGCGTDDPPRKSASGNYITITRDPPNPPSAQTQDISASAVAHVAHAHAEASQTISPWVEIVGNTANIEVFVHSYTHERESDCDDGPPIALADVKAKVDPIVIGSAQYTSYLGGQLDPFVPDFDGMYRYVDEVVSLLEGTGMPGALSGPSPDIAPDGLRKTNGFRVSQNVRAGSDDDPDNTSGTLIYDLYVTPGPNGDPVVTCTLGTDTAEFGFSFDRTAAQIEQDVYDYLRGTGEGDLPMLTATVRMLQDEVAMPNMTLVAVDKLESWLWGSGNPDAIEWPIKWWQGPDVLGATRPSSLLLPPIRADDFECNATGTIDAVRWWGTYSGEAWTHRINTGYSLPFVIYFYDSDGTAHPNSLPVTGAPLSTHNVMANRFFVNWLPTGDALYEFHARLCVPFQQQAGQEYFLSIADPINPAWEWLEATSSQLDQPAASLAPAGPWMHDGFPDLAFALLAPTAVADCDCDHDVDLDDYIIFDDCMAGPGAPPAPVQPGVTEQDCLHAFDFEDDGDVDFADFGGFQEFFGS